MTNMNRIFVYGTLKKGEPNHHWIVNTDNGFAEFIGHGKTTTKWPLVIASKYNIPFLLFEEGKGKIISGEVYDVDDTMLAALDVLEEHPKLYERLQYDIALESSTNDEPRLTKCWIYFTKKYKPFMIELPFIDDYSSEGPHGLPYVLSRPCRESRCLKNGEMELGNSGTSFVSRMEKWNLGILEHPLYSPNLDPNDFQLLGPLKKHFIGHHFQYDTSFMSMQAQHVSQLWILCA